MPNVLPQIACGARAIAAPPPSVRPRTAYTVSEFANELRVNRSTIYRWIERGLLKAETPSGITLIPLAEALRFSREGPPR